ncbi:MAG: tetratricopeptide repeat protein [Actinomycetes bacterium]
MSESSKDRSSSGRSPSSRPAQRSGGRSGDSRDTARADDRASPRTVEPEIPEDVTWYDLDRATRGELRSLPKELAERVGGHLATAGLLIDSDPEAARRHAVVARRLASRVAVVREASALSAYACGDYETALAELRAYRRMSGDQSHLPLMADCERGLGRPERALALAATPEAARLDGAVARELRIVVAGARSDLGQPDAALGVLEQDPGLTSQAVDISLVRLRYSYAEALGVAGRPDEAAQWWAVVARQDVDAVTDAADRVTESASDSAE